MTHRPDPPEPETDGPAEAVGGHPPATTDPGKLIRIAAMTRSVLEEIRRSPLDHEASREVLRIHRVSLEELREVLSDEIQEEFDDIFAPFDDEASEALLRIASAQLIGWLEGLFHGIQATIATQQMLAASQLAQMRPRGQLEGGHDAERPGLYL